MVSRSIYPVTHQSFSLPFPMMSQIYYHRSVILHTKLIQTCKYFYAKNPVVVVKYVDIVNKKYVLNQREEYVSVDYEKLPCKLWITEQVTIAELPNNWSLFLTSIFRFENSYMQFNVGRIPFSVLEKVSEKGTFCDFDIHNYDVTDNENRLVPIEKVIQLFSTTNDVML